MSSKQISEIGCSGVSLWIVIRPEGSDRISGEN